MGTKRVLITGGAGFIGCSACRYFGARNWRVTALDNLSRAGTEKNLTWLRAAMSFDFEQVDVRDRAAVDRVVADGRFDAIIHLAAQVAVTTSVADPRSDFSINALGTFNLLDAVRRYSPEAVFIFASTNKVYGRVAEAQVAPAHNRYAYVNRPMGIGEHEPIDFLSPYGCSKGAADQYTLDFARIYQIPATSFRQSCIYGPRQFGVEDQGWVAWFAIASLLGHNIKIFGDGRQVRDVLHVDDLLRAYEMAILSPDKIRGQAFNIGGGPGQVLSLLDLVQILETRLGHSIPLHFDAWRPGDQRVYVSDVSKLQRVLGWRPEISVAQGLEHLVRWIEASRSQFETSGSGPVVTPKHANPGARASAPAP